MLRRPHRRGQPYSVVWKPLLRRDLRLTYPETATAVPENSETAVAAGRHRSKLAGLIAAIQAVVAGRALVATRFVLTAAGRNAGTAVAAAALAFVALAIDAALLAHVAAILTGIRLIDDRALGTSTVVLTTEVFVALAVATRLPRAAAL